MLRLEGIKLRSMIAKKCFTFQIAIYVLLLCYYNPGSTTNLASATIKKIDEPGCNVYGLKWATKLPPFFAEEIPLTRLIGVRTDPAIFLIVAIDEIVVLPGL